MDTFFHAKSTLPLVISFQLQKAVTCFHDLQTNHDVICNCPYDVICNCPFKQLYNVTNQLLGRTKKTLLLSNILSSDLPDTFCQLFNKEVAQIRNDIDTQSADPPVFQPFTGSKFCDFELVTEVSMLKLILKTASKSCNFDPIPTTLTKQYLDVIILSLLRSWINIEYLSHNWHSPWLFQVCHSQTCT